MIKGEGEELVVRTLQLEYLEIKSGGRGEGGGRGGGRGRKRRTSSKDTSIEYLEI